MVDETGVNETDHRGRDRSRGEGEAALRHGHGLELGLRLGAGRGKTFSRRKEGTTSESESVPWKSFSGLGHKCYMPTSRYTLNIHTVPVW